MTRIRPHAMTIIEVVTAVVILSVGLPTLIKSFADSSNQSHLPINATIASFLCTERMEQIVARRYRNDSGYAALTTVNFPAESPVSGFPRFSRSVTISEVTSSLAASGSAVGYRKVRVTVTWQPNNSSMSIERVFADF